MTHIVTRINGMGLLYRIISNDEDTTTITNDKNTITVAFPMQDIMQWWYNWQMKGEPIQVAFEKFTPDEREFLLTGITAEKWKEIFMVKQDEDDQ